MHWTAVFRLGFMLVVTGPPPVMRIGHMTPHTYFYH